MSDVFEYLISVMLVKLNLDDNQIFYKIIHEEIQIIPMGISIFLHL